MKKTVNLLKQAFFFLKKKITIYGIIILGLVLIFTIFSIVKNGNRTEETVTVKKGDFVQQVSVAGKVVPSENVELSFKNSGRIDRIYFSVDDFAKTGKIIKAGTLIAQIDAKDAIKNLHDAEINLENARLSLEKIKLQNSEENTNSDLQTAYDNGFSAVSDAFLDLSDILNGIEDILNESNLSNNAASVKGKTAVSLRNKAESAYYLAEDAFKDNQKNFREITRESSKTEIENSINLTYNTVKLLTDAVKSTKNFVDYMADETGSGSDFTVPKSTLFEYTSTLNTHLSNLYSSKTDIKDNQDSSSTSSLDIKSAELNVKEKENSLRDAQNRLSDYYIRAPFDGIITKIDAKIGEMASANMPLVSMMSDGAYQIESFVPEVNISKIKVGDEAQITLDAYGDEVQFSAVVVSIDPAETIKDGVSTYKVKLQFVQKDERIKSGMTANAMIIVFKKPNTIVISSGSIFEKDGKKFVQILGQDKKIINREVTLGEDSSLGQVEIIAGLTEGDVIIFNPKVQ